MSGLGLFAVARGVISGIPAAPFIVVIVAAAGLAAALTIVFRWLFGRPRWIAALAITLGVLALYAALAVTGTERASLATAKPEVVIGIVSLLAGAASSLTSPGRWRILGFVGLAGGILVALTPLFVGL